MKFVGERKVRDGIAALLHHCELNLCELQIQGWFFRIEAVEKYNILNNLK